MSGADMTIVTPELLVRVYRELAAALGGIRQGRDTLLRVNTLSDVSCATESATTGMLDGLDRSLALIDRLETEVAAQATATATLSELRDGITALFGLLQFQDITAQQLAGISGLLEDIEGRVATVVGLLEGPVGGAQTAAPPSQVTRSTFNRDATVHDRARRQADIDRAFGQTPSSPRTR
jgi:hypothetical protein